MFGKIIGEAKGTFNIITIVELVVSLIILLGSLVFISSNLKHLALGIIVGILLILNGTSKIYAYKNRNKIDLYNNNLIYGLIIIALGITSFVLSKYITIIISLFLIINAVNNINYSILLKKFNENSCYFTGVVGLFLIIIGIVSYFTNQDSVNVVSGICLLGYSIMNLINTILLRKRSQYFIA